MRIIAAIVCLCALAPAFAQTTGPSAETAPPEPKHISLTGALPAELKCHKAISGHLMVSPLINGQQLGEFIFDTGAGMTCLDAQIVKKLDLPEAGETVAKGSGGSQATKFRAIKSLALGPVLIEDSAVVELDLRMIGLAMRAALNGIIGYECFLGAIYEIDLANSKVVVHDPKKFQLPEGAQWQKLVIQDRRPYVEAKIENNEPGLYLIDTGANGAITVHAPAVKKLKLLEGRKTDQSGFGGVGGIRAARKGSVESFTVCGNTLRNVDTTFSQAEKGALAEDTSQGTIGLELLNQFRVIVDYSGGRVALIPGK